MRLVHDSLSLSRLEAFGRSLGGLLCAGDVILMEGPLGAGKTTLVRSIAAGLGIDPGMVSSPTFVVINQYPRPLEEGELVHVDAYRLSGPGDLESIGWDRVTEARPRPILAVEWAERLGDSVVPGWAGPPARISIHPVGEEVRDVTIDVPDEWSARPGVDALRPRAATTCRITGRPVAADSPTWPFADERARMADLYRWLSGRYSVEAAESDDEQGP